jgi:23S rRNA (adenine2503-C2)-methyltransferase
MHHAHSCPHRRTGRRVTFEYTLLAGVNDGDAHARELAALLRSHFFESHVNLIPWNPVDESTFKRPSNNRVYAFKRLCEEGGLTTTVRETRGLEAAAACGQLRNAFQKSPLPEFQAPK